jgi:hypothetical protein
MPRLVPFALALSLASIASLARAFLLLPPVPPTASTTRAGLINGARISSGSGSGIGGSGSVGGVWGMRPPTTRMMAAPEVSQSVSRSVVSVSCMGV